MTPADVQRTADGLEAFALKCAGQPQALASVARDVAMLRALGNIAAQAQGVLLIADRDQDSFNALRSALEHFESLRP